MSKTPRVHLSETSSRVAPVRRSIVDMILDEGAIPIVRAAAMEGVEITAKTGLRWSISGKNGARLETVKIAGRRLTSRAAFRRFVKATQDRAEVPSPALDRESADKILDAFGLGRKEA